MFGIRLLQGELLMMKLKYLFLVFTSLLIAIACGQDYLGGGNVGSSDATDIAQYFTDPIFTPTLGRSSTAELGADVLSLLWRGVLQGLRPALSIQARHLCRTLWSISFQPGAILFRL